jgi:hypothetical protein
VPEDAVRAGHVPSLDEDRAVPLLEVPGPPLHGAPCVQDGEIDLGAALEPIEHPRPVGRRFRKDHRDANWAVGHARVESCGGFSLGAR